MVLEFQRAERVGDPFDGVLQAMGPVVSGVEAPLVSRVVMRSMNDAVHDRVAHVHVRVGHVYLGPQDPFPFGIIACPHSLQQLEVLLDRAISVRACRTRGRQRSPLLPDFLS